MYVVYTTKSSFSIYLFYTGSLVLLVLFLKNLFKINNLCTKNDNSLVLLFGTLGSPYSIIISRWP